MISFVDDFNIYYILLLLISLIVAKLCFFFCSWGFVCVCRRT